MLIINKNKMKLKSIGHFGNRRGQVIMVNLLLFFMALAVLVAMIPAMKAMLDITQQSDSLNCPGYTVNGDATNKLSYNASLSTSTLSCMAINLYLPYIILVVLVAGVTKLLSGRIGDSGQSPM